MRTTALALSPCSQSETCRRPRKDGETASDSSRSRAEWEGRRACPPSILRHSRSERRSRGEEPQRSRRHVRFREPLEAAVHCKERPTFIGFVRNTPKLGEGSGAGCQPRDMFWQHLSPSESCPTAHKMPSRTQPTQIRSELSKSSPPLAMPTPQAPKAELKDWVWGGRLPSLDHLCSCACHTCLRGSESILFLSPDIASRDSPTIIRAPHPPTPHGGSSLLLRLAVCILLVMALGLCYGHTKPILLALEDLRNRVLVLTLRLRHVALTCWRCLLEL
ncbi:PREDICTED: nutritionally-regulated adipose and cardiac enriched protein homolog [Chrysochloris asiatica]|uniref:Nutritionally-regulated adipose and cardiac enriched protein homolog n=1 Tax=Chrysochloris asiatica TaxID=185453 RepID=A0A9B0T5Y8_CHRAS|nr:PREDICTED: nutritionally-regulated adipose and cardiac enriched protein homolog [Chrysochloris asiatica]